MYKVILTGERMLNYFSCFDIPDSWMITSNNLEIIPDKVQYISKDGHTEYSDIFIKNNDSLLNYNINSDEIDYSYSSLESNEYIVCYFESEEEAFYFKLKYS